MTAHSGSDERPREWLDSNEHRTHVRAMPADKALAYMMNIRNIVTADIWLHLADRDELSIPSRIFRYTVSHNPVNVPRKWRRRELGSRPNPALARCLQPVHPILLASALTLFRRRACPRAEATLSAYVGGYDIPNLDEYIDYAATLPAHEAVNILAEEATMLASLERIGEKKAINTKMGMRWPESWDRDRASVWDLRLAAWFHCNPISIALAEPFWHSALRYGFGSDGLAHSTRESIQVELGKATTALNAALGAGDPAALASEAARHKALSMRLERIMQIYLWMPHEISAYAAELSSVRWQTKELDPKYAVQLLSPELEQTIVSLRHG